jgi:NDP-sugar pyrophosphorylase family protein
MSKTQAIILAGGKGSRLRPYTTVLPKPLMPLGDYPIAEIIIRQFRNFGIRNITVSTGHLAELIEAFFGNGKRWGVHITYVRENKPLGTAGAIQLVKNLEDDFLVVNGDVLTDVNFNELLKFHRKKNGIATITTKERTVVTDFGVIESNGSGELLDYIEKPEHKSYVSMGVYILNKKCKKYLKKDECIGMPELMVRMKNAGERVSCFKAKAMWLDLGRFDDFDTAQDVFAKHKKRFIAGL